MASVPFAARSAGGHAAAPLYDALRAWAERGITPLFTPAHRGQAFAGCLDALLTPIGLACDLPCMDGTDHAMHPAGCLRAAQELAADLFDAGDTFFLTNGATSGVQAMMLATLAPGDAILLNRHFHLSAFAGLVLAGAVPIYLPSNSTDDAGPIPTTAAEVEAHLSRHPRVRAVFLTHPTYYGVGRSLAPIAAVCRRRNIPLLVDEAHGAHLRFLPRGHLRSGLSDGADLVVQSPHKTLGSAVGTAQLHRGRTSLIGPEKLRAALNLLQSTSPSFLLLASLDLVRRDLARDGVERFRQAAEAAARLRSALGAIPGLKLLEPRGQALKGCAIDPMRLIVGVSELGLTGFEVEARLFDEFNLLCEFSDVRNVGFVLSPVDGPAVYALLVRALRRIAGERPPRRREKAGGVRASAVPELVLTPREAAFAPKKTVPWAAAIGAVSGETITLYPPGIPAICPGERFTQAILNDLAEFAWRGAPLMCSDPSLATVRVVAAELP